MTVAVVDLVRCQKHNAVVVSRQVRLVFIGGNMNHRSGEMHA